MQVRQLRAEPAADGRIALSWRTPSEAAFRGVRVLRRARRFPDERDLGTTAEVHHDAATPANTDAAHLDGPLQGETVYYYAVVAYDAANRPFPAFVSAMAATPYQTDAHLYRSLPEIYQLFNDAQAGASTAGLAGGAGLVPDGNPRGALRRLIEIISQPFDLLRSFNGAMRDFHDVQRVDGALLPLLAQWIGQPSDITLDLDRQRNEIRYAPQYYRTRGVPANLRAAINRFVNWDARIKEFVHNIFLTTHPEQLTIWAMRREGATWREATNENLEIAYEGRVAPLLTQDGRTWLFYHARRSGAPARRKARGQRAEPVQPEQDRWHVFTKIDDRGEPQPSLRLTFGRALHKHPTAVQRPDGAVWLFYGRQTDVGGRHVPRIGLQVLAAGRPAMPARVDGTAAGPFTLTDGDTLEVTIGAGPSSITRRVTVRAEHLRASLASVPAAEVARWLDGELPAVDVTTSDDQQLHLRTRAVGTTALLTIAASPLATALGFAAGVTTGSDATDAALTGTIEAPFALQDGAVLSLRVDHEPPRPIVFRAADFANIAQASVAEVVAAIERQRPGLASAAGDALRLRSQTKGAQSLLGVIAEDSPAAAALGLGILPPLAPEGVDEDEPSACIDASGFLWMFWASRRSGRWKVWYNASDGQEWGTPKPLTTGTQPDREPYAVADPRGGGRLWVFWTRKRPDGLRNVFSRTAANPVFSTVTDADWTEREHTPAPVGFENREPAAILGAAAGEVELYVASNRIDGWNIWTRTVTTATQGAESAVTTGQVTRRAPAPLREAQPAGPPPQEGAVRLYLRANESQVYESGVYPSAITVDARYSGSTAIDLRNATKLSLRGLLGDLQRYTYDTRVDLADLGTTRGAALYSRQTVGVYLTPDTDDQALILRQSRLFANALRAVLPIQVRIVFLLDQAHTELVYTYGRPDVQPQAVIDERMIDTILSEVVGGAIDSHRDRLPGVRFLRTWIPGESAALPDLSVTPPALSSFLYTPRADEDA